MHIFIFFSAAVALEKKNQRATLRKQREDYRRRSNALKRELNILREQRDDLISGSEPPSPTTKGFLKENDRLQVNKYFFVDDFAIKIKFKKKTTKKETLLERKEKWVSFFYIGLKLKNSHSCVNIISKLFRSHRGQFISIS